MVRNPLEFPFLLAIFIIFNVFLIGILDFPMNLTVFLWLICVLIGIGAYLLWKIDKEDRGKEENSRDEDKDKILIGKVYGKKVLVTKQFLESLEGLIPDEKERDKFLHKIARTMWERGMA